MNRELINMILEAYKVSRGTYGSPRITMALRKQGITCGRNRIVRLMQENEIAARTKRKFKAIPTQSTTIQSLKTWLTKKLTTLKGILKAL
jgi:transposase InsO family protein